jgi:hypothetical protein
MTGADELALPCRLRGAVVPAGFVGAVSYVAGDRASALGPA